MAAEGSSDLTQSVSKSSKAFFLGTLLSRVSGLGRDIMMASVFGSHPALAAFMVAFRFANLIRRLFGEGPLPSSFIPHFEHLKAESLEKAIQFFKDVFYSLVVFLIILVLGIEVALFGVLKWGHLNPDNAQILYLTMLMLPGVLFICLFGLSGGILQCEQRYFLTGIAPAAFNAVWIVTLFFLRGKDPVFAVVPLSLSIVLAFFMQWMMIAPRTFDLLKTNLNSSKGSFSLFSPEVRALLKPFFLAIVGVAAVQINSSLDAVFARYASLEGPAYLWYAIRVQQLPLALFGIALSAALLPPLSRAIKEGNFSHYLSLLRFAFRRSFSLIFPCVIGIFVLGATGINLLYGRMHFSHEATYQTILCLWGYGWGLLPSVFVLLLAPAFYANKNYRTPMIGSMIAVVLNSGVTAFFIFVLKWGAMSTAMATSFFAWFNYFYLSSRLLINRETPLLDRETFVSFGKVISATFISGFATLFLGYFLFDDPTLQMILGEKQIIFSRDFPLQIMQFLFLSVFFVGLFLLSAWILKAKDVLQYLPNKKFNL